MAISFTKVASLVVAQVDANSTYSTSTSDPRFYTAQIRDAITLADIELMELLLEDEQSPYRQNFFTPVNVAHAAQIPAHIGDVGAVLLNGKGAEIWSKAEIEVERVNPLGLTTLQAHYMIDSNDRIFHNYSGNAVVDIIVPLVTSAADPPVLQSPEGFADAVACRALAFLFSVEGEDPETAQHYERMWESFVEAIKKHAPPGA